MSLTYGQGFVVGSQCVSRSDLRILCALSVLGG
jgi:hypothetical protein